MVSRIHVCVVAAALVAAPAACKSKKKKVEKAPDEAPTADGPTNPTTPTPDTTPALPAAEKTPAALRKTLDRLVGAPDPSSEAQLAKDLVLEDPSAFFTRTFGAEVGARLATSYQAESARVASFAKIIRLNQINHGRHKTIIEEFTDPEDPRATGLQARALAAMSEPTPLYSVRFTALKKSGELHLFSFVHDGVRFRYVGPLVELAGASSKDGIAVLRRRQGAR